MPLDRDIGFIGAGNMGGALIRALLNKKLARPEQIWIADADAEKRGRLAAELRVNTATQNAALVAECDVIVLAVKPQTLPAVLAELRGSIQPEQLFISVAAGVRTGKIEQALGGRPRVVRVMPNTPALIGCGAAALCRGAHATAEDAALTRFIFDAVGISVVVDEAQLDAVTGLSGSGPAYFFYMIESLIAAGIAEGLPADVAGQLVIQTALGAARMAKESGESPARLREMVTSPNGTTFAGLEKLRAGNFAQLIQDCVARAAARANELGRD